MGNRASGVQRGSAVPMAMVAAAAAGDGSGGGRVPKSARQALRIETPRVSAFVPSVFGELRPHGRSLTVFWLL